MNAFSLSHRWTLFVLLLALGFAGGCSNLSVFLTNPRSEFTGIDTVTIDEDGHFRIAWKALDRVAQYEVYVSSSTLPPAGYQDLKKVDSTQDEFLSLHAKTISAKAEESNLVLLEKNLTATQFIYKETIDQELFYTFFVKAVGPSAKSSDAMPTVIAKPNLGLADDISLKTLSSNEGSKIRLAWTPGAGALSYDIYRDADETVPLLSSVSSGVDMEAYLERFPGLCIRSKRGSLVSSACQPVATSGKNAFITGVSALTPNGYYREGTDVVLEVQYSNPVTVDGIPELPLNNGQYALYIAGTGTSKLLFSYTVATGGDIEFLDVVTGAEIELSWGTRIVAAGDLPANKTLPLNSDDATLRGHDLITIDTLSPSLPSPVNFAARTTKSTTFDVFWTGSVDVNLKKHNLKLCSANDCNTGCGVVQGTNSLNASVSGVDGSSYYACVQGEDKAGHRSAWVSSSQPISVDTTSPLVDHLSATSANAYYKAGDTLQLNVHFSEPVSLLGSIELTLDLGLPNRKAIYVSGSGTSNYLFQYTIQAGDNTSDLDVSGSTALALTPGSSVLDVAGNAAVLAVPYGIHPQSLRTNADVVVDTLLPTPPTSVHFNGTVSGTTTFPVAWTQGVEANLKHYNLKACLQNDCNTGCSAVFTSTLPAGSASGTNGSTYYACAQAQDKVDQVSSWAVSSATLTVDTNIAGVNFVSSPTPDAIYTIGDVLTIDVTFSKIVNATSTGDLGLRLGLNAAPRIATYSTGTGTNTLRFAYTIQAGDNSEDLSYHDSMSLTLGSNGHIRDAGGIDAILSLPNAGSGDALDDRKALIVDTTSPTAPTAVSFGAAYSPTAAVSFNWTNSVDLHLRYHNAKLCAQNDCSTSCIGASTAVSSPATLTGVNGSSYFACVQGEDLKGQKSSWIPSASSLTIDTTPPTVVSIDSSAVDGIYDAGESIPITVHMSETVVITTPTSLTLALEVGANIGLATYVSHIGSDIQFTYLVASGDVSQDLEIKASNALALGSATIKDVSGLIANITLPTTGPTSLSGQKAIIVDTTAPSAPSSVGFSGSLTNTATFNVLWSDSTDTNFLRHNVKICEASDCLTSCVSATSSLSSPVAVTGVDNKTYYGCVQGEDKKGHTSSFVASTTTVRVDTSPPSVLNVTSSKADGLYKIGTVIPVTVKFSEPVYLGSGSNIALSMSNGGAGAAAIYVSGSGTDSLLFSYEVIEGDSSSDLEVASGSSLALSGGTTLRDSALNTALLTLPTSGANSLSGQKNIVIDGIKPTVPASVTFAAPGETINPSRVVQWTASTDAGFLRHNVKLCENNDCSTSCLSTSTSVTSPKTLVGSAGKSYYACVQGEDTAGNFSNWSVSAGQAVIDPSPTITAVASGEILGSWPNGKGKVKLNFTSPPTGHIDSYSIYFSTTNSVGTFNLTTAVATISRGDATFDANPNDTAILIEVPPQVLDDGYYIVRYNDTGAYFPDTNTLISPLIEVLKGHPQYKLVPKKWSSLAYDYYIMKYEASLDGGANPGGDTLSFNETNIAACSAKFHTQGIVADATCGTRSIVAKALSVKGVSPLRSTRYTTAWFSCRNSSDSNALIRMPTREEWTRATRNIFPSYAASKSFNTTNTASSCNQSSGSIRNTGASSSCVTTLGLYDTVGNVSEWVDQLIVKRTLDSRFGVSLVTGRALRNGIDNLTYNIEDSSPGNYVAAMLMGGFYSSSGASHKSAGQFGFLDAFSTGGFGLGHRCIGFRADSVPSMSDLALADEPKFTAADLTESVTTRRVPENKSVSDNKIEKVEILLSGDTSNPLAEGNVRITWDPWQKTVCDTAGVCTPSDAGLSYKIYRFLSPNRTGNDEDVTWAIGDATSVYGSDTYLDPLNIDLSMTPTFDTTTSNGKLITTITNCDSSNMANCSFTDNASTGFSPNVLYEYLLVVGSGSTNFRYAMSQRMRSPYIVGTYNSFIAFVSSRFEPRYRRAGVFPVDPGYQLAQTAPQIMVHVPMDISGLDRDFFMQKYEASLKSGAILNDLPGGTYGYPAQGSSGAALCQEALNRTDQFVTSLCSTNAMGLHASTAIMKSVPGATAQDSISQGTSWKACQNTPLIDGNGKSYRLHLPTSAEWFKAADWGDVDFDGTIDQNSFVSGTTSIAALQLSSSPDTSSIRCHVDGSPASAYSTGNAATANCVSRYGAENMVGNLAEWTFDKVSAGKGLDNGIDTLWKDRTFSTTDSTAYDARYNLLSALPKTGGSAPYNLDDYYHAIPNTTAAFGTIRGGAYDANLGAPGRFTLDVSHPSDISSPRVGFRCAY